MIPPRDRPLAVGVLFILLGLIPHLTGGGANGGTLLLVAGAVIAGMSAVGRVEVAE